jgi:DmsE family decaheme c-type cytochrome
VIALAIVFTLLVAQRAQAQTPAEAHAAPYAVDDCRTCHEKPVAGMASTPHSKLEMKCSSCHGDPTEHMKGSIEKGEPGPIASIEKMKPDEVNKTCLGCHDKARQANWGGGVHERRGVSCVSCHSLHDSRTTKALLKAASDSETCFACHKSERAKSLRTSHHPVREGKMGCASCHDPHDGSRQKLLQADSTNEVCYKCHAEKRGPFLYEHAPVREECTNCHDPHGSNHERLLVAKQPFLCQRCHFSGHGLTADNASSLEGLPIAPPGATVTRSSRNTERGCKQCHLNIHGSNSPSGAFFVR